MVICLYAIAGGTFVGVVRVDVVELFVCRKHAVNELVQACSVHFVLFFLVPVCGLPSRLCRGFGGAIVRAGSCADAGGG